ADPRGRIQGPRQAPDAQVRYLRRAWRRTFVGRILPLCGPELRELLAVPRAHRTPGGRTRSPQGEISLHRQPPEHPYQRKPAACMPQAFVFSDKKVRFVEKFLLQRISFVYLLRQTV